MFTPGPSGEPGVVASRPNIIGEPTSWAVIGGGGSSLQGARLIKKYTQGASSSGGAGYYATYQYKSGAKTRQLSSSALVLKSGSLATTTFKYYKSDIKNTVVWMLKIEYDIDIGLTKPEAIAELKRYAPKAMKRVGSG